MLFISTKAQVWSLDIIIALLIFVGGLLIFYNQSIANIGIREKDINNILLDGKVISGYLVSPGYPLNWTEDNVTLIGLTDSNLALNEDKVSQFYNLALNNYSVTKRRLSTSHDYYVFFEDKNNNKVEVNGISSIGQDYTAEDPDDVIKIVRFVYYNSMIIKLVLYIW